MADIHSLDGNVKGTLELPHVFSESVRRELIQRAVLAENSYKLQPQGHYPLAGMQTSAMYYGAMHSYRTGRHMGIAIRPREKLGGGVQGKVRRIPSSVKGKRAHPHMVEKNLIEQMNKREYRLALSSAVAASKDPIIVINEIENVKKTKDLVKIFENLKLSRYIEGSSSPHLRKGHRRSTQQRIFKRSILLIVGKESPALRSARNIPGVDVCLVSDISANLLAPGGVPGRVTVWSEDAVKGVSAAIERQQL